MERLSDCRGKGLRNVEAIHNITEEGPYPASAG